MCPAAGTLRAPRGQRQGLSRPQALRSPASVPDLLSTSGSSACAARTRASPSTPGARQHTGLPASSGFSLPLPEPSGLQGRGVNAFSRRRHWEMLGHCGARRGLAGCGSGAGAGGVGSAACGGRGQAPAQLEAGPGCEQAPRPAFPFRMDFLFSALGPAAGVGCAPGWGAGAEGCGRGSCPVLPAASGRPASRAGSGATRQWRAQIAARRKRRGGGADGSAAGSVPAGLLLDPPHPAPRLSPGVTVPGGSPTQALPCARLHVLQGLGWVPRRAHYVVSLWPGSIQPALKWGWGLELVSPSLRPFPLGRCVLCARGWSWLPV